MFSRLIQLVNKKKLSKKDKKIYIFIQTDGMK